MEKSVESQIIFFFFFVLRILQRLESGGGRTTPFLEELHQTSHTVPTLRPREPVPGTALRG